MSQATYLSTWPDVNGRPILEPSRARLRTYTGAAIPTHGRIRVPVRLPSDTTEPTLLPLVIVDGEGPTLLGRDWLHAVRLDWTNIHNLQTPGRDANPKQPRLQALLNEYDDLFSDELGTYTGPKAHIVVRDDAQPRFFKARPVPYAYRDNVCDELRRLEREKVIEPVQHSDWAAPVVPVVKDDGSIRLCGDYKLTVNRASQDDQYPLPNVEDMFATLTGGKTFTKLDLRHAYAQVPLDDTSKVYTTINTPLGLFRYNRMPFGVSSAPSCFQRIIEGTLQGIPHTLARVDDILVTGENDDEHLANLTAVLSRLRTAGLRLKRVKCSFMEPSVTYMRFVIDAEGTHPTDEKVRALKAAPTPQNKSELRSFLGLLNFYRKFIPNLSTMAEPLNRLLRDNTPFDWTDAQQDAFDSTKAAVCSSSVLIHYDRSKPLRLACDASPHGVGAVLSHVLPDGSERPVAFASRSLSSAERNYAQIDREGLSLIFGVKKFHNYIYAKAFTLVTDHKPLLDLFGEDRAIPVMASSRVQRWALILAAYNYRLVHRAGKAHGNADAMSRLPLPESPGQVPTPGESVLLFDYLSESPVTSVEIQRWTSEDPDLSTVLDYTRQGWPHTTPQSLQPYLSRRDELSLQDGCLLWGQRVVIPPPARARILQDLHTGHPGITRMKALARSFVWWPGLDQALEQTVQTCQACQEHRASPPPAPMHPWIWPDRPWSRLHLDYAGPVEDRMLLIVVDAHSKWIEALPSSSSTAATTINHLRQLFATHGLPDTIVTDNGPCFTSTAFTAFLSASGIEHIRTSPYHPASNGQAERAVQTVKRFLKKMKHGSIEKRLSQALLQYRIREHLISSQFFSKRNAFQIGFTPLPPPSIRKAYRTFSDNNRCRLSSRPSLSTTKLLRASLLSFSSREASADNIISTSSSFSPFPVSLHASSALRLASTRGRKGLQATYAFTNFS